MPRYNRGKGTTPKKRQEGTTVANTSALRRGRNIDMTSGPLLPSILRFILPLMATNLLQQLYSAADMMIVGLSSEPDAVGGVGSSAAFLSLILNVFIGFSVGANVVVARHIGEQDQKGTERAVHTAVCMSVLFGVLGGAVGLLLTRPVLVGMGYDGKLLELAIRYSYLYLACLPFLSMTNFLSAILQAQGNTRTPFFVLMTTGVLNVCLNLFFVLVVGFSVEGVAIATAIANLTSAIWFLIHLYKKGGDCRIIPRKLRFHRAEFLNITRIGFPAGIQNAMFSISNLIIQSSILQVNNALTPPGSAYAPIIKGNTAVSSAESFIFSSLNATTAAASAFTAQNLGAKKPARIRRSLALLCLISTVIAIVMSTGMMLLHTPLLALYGVTLGTDLLSRLARDAALARMFWKWPGFFTFGLMNAFSGTLRGLGKSALAALIAFFGTCVFRIVWVYTVFPVFENLESIHISYPLSWLLTGAVFFAILIPLFRKMSRDGEDKEA